MGRIDIVENRYISLKSRGCYETPDLTILRTAHIDLEGLTLDREVRALRDQFVTFHWSRILYCGHYFSPEREFLHASIIESQKSVNGQVRLRLYKGNCIVLGRSSVSLSLSPYMGIIRVRWPLKRERYRELSLWILFIPSLRSPFLSFNDYALQRQVEPNYFPTFDYYPSFPVIMDLC